MCASKRISLSLGLPHHGWLPISFSAGGFAWEWHASGVLNDPVWEFLGLLLALGQRSRLDKRICVWLEPDGYALDFATQRPRQTTPVKLDIGYSDSFVPPMRHNEVEPLGSVELDADALYREFMSSLSSFLQDYGGELRRHWIKGKTRAEYLGVLARAGSAWREGKTCR